MQVEIIKITIPISHLGDIAAKQFGDLVKAVVDIEGKIMAIGGELHADEEAVLLEKGSSQANLWGVNLYPDKFGSDEFIEFDSLINIRPSQGNRSRGVDDAKLRSVIAAVVNHLVE